MATKNITKKAKWINNMTRELEGLEAQKRKYTSIYSKIYTRKFSNWKTPRHDGIHSFLFKKFTSIHDRLALEMNKCIQRTPVPGWMTNGRTTLIQKEPKHGNTHKQSQTYIFPTDDVDNINSTNRGRYLLLANKPWIVRWGTERMPQTIQKHSRVTLQHILNESKTKRKNLAMAWIDYKKVYDMVPESWIINCLKTYKISDKVISFIEKTIKIWRVELTAGGRSLVEAKIQSGIFKKMHYHRNYS